jgi:hypothetical protein
MNIINVASNESRIPIGIRGENEARQIVFDLSWLIQTYGQGTAVLLAKRSEDENAYPVTLAEQSGTTLTWTVTDVDTYYVGHGKAELFWYIDNVLAKSIVYSTWTEQDIGTASGEAPDPYEDWVEELTELGAVTLANAQRAEAAQSGAETAERGASAAQTAAETAQRKAEQAQSGAETAERNANTAKTDAQTAQRGAEQAKTDAQTAQRLAETAQGKAEDAERGAKQAEQSILGLTASASVDNTVGTPSVSVTVTEVDDNKNMDFAFHNLKGDKGDKGDTGNVYYATFEIDPTTGILTMNYDTNYEGAQFQLNNGYLEVVI